MKILIVGLGSIAKKHIHVIRELVPEAEIFALRSRAGGEAFEGIQHVYDWHEVPRDLGFILISNPTAFHAAAIAQSLDFQCPIFIEKPVLMRLEEGRELLSQMRQTNPLTYVACNLRFLGCIKYVRDYISTEKPRINEASLYCGSYLPDWRPGTDYTKSYSADPDRGGGVQLDLIHELDYMYWIFGKPTTSQALTRNQSSLNIQAPDFAHYVCQYPDFTAMVSLNYYRRKARRTFEIVFENKTWQVDLLTNTITQEDEVIFHSDKTILDTYRDQMEYFLSCISSEKPCMNDFEEAMEVLEICLS